MPFSYVRLAFAWETKVPPRVITVKSERSLAGLLSSQFRYCEKQTSIKYQRHFRPRRSREIRGPSLRLVNCLIHVLKSLPNLRITR